MPLLRHAGSCAKAGWLCAALMAGCASASKQTPVAMLPPSPPAARLAETLQPASSSTNHGSPRARSPEFTVVNFEEPAAGVDSSAGDGEELFSGQAELALPALVSAIQQRNQSLQAVLAAWGAAVERFPQVVALEDPTLQTMFAPASFSSSTIQSSYILGIAQKLPWSGKRELRGQVAQWQAIAASLDYDEAQLRLAETARLAYYEFYYVHRQLEINDAGLAAVQSFRDTANSKFIASQVTQQDVLQADVELAQLEQRRVEIDQARQVAIARINTLLHREPQLHLPPPPVQIEISGALPDVDALRAIAVEKRPDLAAMGARLGAEQNELSLMYKDYYPDFELMGKYDTFWTDPAQRAQVAMNLNIPLNQNRRQAAVREATFRVNKMQAEYNQQLDTVRSEVQVAGARLSASRRTLDLYINKLLPATQANVAAATSGYEAGTVDFLRLIQAQREFIELNDKYQMAIVEYLRNRAELDRVVGAAW